MLNDRLACFLPSLISKNQSGFVKNRAIIDNTLLAQEMSLGVDNTTRGSNVIVKLDMMKAYDRVHWSFLASVLASFGFHNDWITLVMNIVTSYHYRTIVNGEIYGYFQAHRGLRQGDPLSATLFILMSEYLSRSLNALFAENPSMYYVVPKGILVTRLAYADDCIIFCNGS